MAKPDAQGARRWVIPSILGTAVLTIGTAGVGWASNTYGWQSPLMTFAVGVTVVAAFGTISLIAVQCLKRFVLEALKYHRSKLVTDTLTALRRHEAEQWARATGLLKPTEPADN